MNICMIVFGEYVWDSRVIRTSEALARRGDSVDVVCLKFPDLNRTLSNLSNNHIVFPQGGHINLYPINIEKYWGKRPLGYLLKFVIFFLKSTILVSKLYFKKKYSVVHVHGVPNSQVFAAFVPKLFGTRIILDIHDLMPEFFARKFGVSDDHIIIKALKIEEKICSCYADRIITVTEPWRAKLINRGIPAEKCTVVMNVPDPDIFNANGIRKYEKSKNFKILYYGTFSEVTGTDLLVKAMWQIKKAIWQARLTMIGGGPQRDELLRLSRELGLNDCIDMKPGVPTRHLPSIIGESDICIDPKRDGVFAGETLSVKLMEYMIMRKPVIASKTKMSSYYFDESMVAFFEPGNEESLAEAVIRLYKEPKKRKQLVTNSAGFLKKYNWLYYKQIYLDLVDKQSNQSAAQ